MSKMSELIKKINKEIKNYPFEFLENTPANALTFHNAPYTGSCAVVIPKGVKARLGRHMNTLNYYFHVIDGYYPQQLIDEAWSAARESSPIPERFNGGLVFFINIPTMLSNNIRFLPEDPTNSEERFDIQEILSILNQELAVAKQCAIYEASVSFQRMVKGGWCEPELSDEERTMLLNLP